MQKPASAERAAARRIDRSALAGLSPAKARRELKRLKQAEEAARRAERKQKRRERRKAKRKAEHQTTRGKEPVGTSEARPQRKAPRAARARAPEPAAPPRAVERRPARPARPALEARAERDSEPPARAVHVAMTSLLKRERPRKLLGIALGFAIILAISAIMIWFTTR